MWPDETRRHGQTKTAQAEDETEPAQAEEAPAGDEEAPKQEDTEKYFTRKLYLRLAVRRSAIVRGDWLGIEFGGSNIGLQKLTFDRSSAKLELEGKRRFLCVLVFARESC